jgi:hypothetical protein
VKLALNARQVRAWALAIGLLALAVVAHANQCKGRFPNPFADICWSCTFPMKIGKATIMGKGQDDNNTSNQLACSCSSGVNINVGANVSFWEPVRIAEVVRHPYCFPMLNGAKLSTGIAAPAHATSADQERDPPGSFYQAHWYANPVLFYLETIMDNACLEKNVFDMAYMTELDPLWADTDATFILNPDAALFTGFPAKVAAAYDCVQASAGMAKDEIFWAAGCQGHMYPLNGFVSEFLVFSGAFPTFTALTIISATSVVITAAYYLWTIQRMFLGKLNPKYAHTPDIAWRERLTLYPLAAICIVLGFYPQAILSYINGTLHLLVQNIRPL